MYAAYVLALVFAASQGAKHIRVIFQKRLMPLLPAAASFTPRSPLGNMLITTGDALGIDFSDIPAEVKCSKRKQRFF